MRPWILLIVVGGSFAVVGSIAVAVGADRVEEVRERLI